MIKDDLTFETIGPHRGPFSHMNKGILITHQPTGFVVACDEHRSQHKNKESCLMAIMAELESIKQPSSK